MTDPVLLLKLSQMTTDAIKAYSGTREQLADDWPDIMEDIIEVLTTSEEV